VDLPAADDGHDRVAKFLEPQRVPNNVRQVRSHLYRTRISEKVGSVEHVHMEGVALYPLAEVEEATQFPDLATDEHASRVLHGVHCTGLIRDRADATDPGCDVWCLTEVTPTKKRLVEAGWFEDIELQVGHLIAVDLEVHCTFTLDPGEIVDCYLSAIIWHIGHWPL
jgi:hypothetical protein